MTATIAALVAVAFAAGLVDAIAGGGGLLTLPALLTAGLAPQAALATNKGQSVFGSFAALLRYARGGLVARERAQVAFPAGFVGSLLGGLLLLALDPKVLKPLVLVLLVGAGLFVAFRPQPRRATSGASPTGPREAGSETQHAPVKRPALVTALIASGIGFYDGFFGPGTGTFLIVAFVAVLGDELTRATAEAKVVNFASNLAAVTLFGLRGLIVWQIALPMAAAQFVGGLVGAQLAMKSGGPLIRRMVLLVVVALVAKLGWDLLHG
ncbi:MAG: TSUP family transporter [Myxococcaceae bacterium]|nr:TSUP family transporter [Myxococcaceae bacterium]